MATLFESSLSGNAMRQSFMVSANPSMADTLPSANFGFDDLRDRMNKFTVKFDQFIAEGRKRVLEERNKYRSHMAELEEDQKMKQRGIEILSQKSQSHANTIAKEIAENDDMHSAIAEISSQRDERAAQRDRLKGEITSTQKSVAQRLDAQRKHAADMDAQAKLNDPELDFWVDYLCLRIEGIREDHLKFIFTHVEERDWNREYWFELSTMRPDYEVTHCKPQLDKERIDICVDRLNESRDVGCFLKDMRELFAESVK